MFTVKVCSNGKDTYYETDAVEREVLNSGTIMLRFTAQNDERRIAFAGISGNIECHPPEDAAIAERAYIMNDQGKTVEVIR